MKSWNNRSSKLFLLLFSDEIYKRPKLKGLGSYCKAETTFTFYFSILTLLSAFLSINNIEMKSESGFSFAMASQPFHRTKQGFIWPGAHQYAITNGSAKRNNLTGVANLSWRWNRRCMQWHLWPRILFHKQNLQHQCHCMQNRPELVLCHYKRDFVEASFLGSDPSD